MIVFPFKTDPDVWLKYCDLYNEYDCVAVDDIMMMGKDPAKFFKDLTKKYKYNLKGVGKPSYHLGGDFSRDIDGTFTWGTASYIRKMLSNYELMFGMKSRNTPPQCKKHIIQNLISPLC